MSKTPNYDAKVKEILDSTEPGQRVCELTGETFDLDAEHIRWARELQVPPTQWKPEARNKYLAGFANGIALWRNKHAETGKEMYSYVHPDSVVPIVTDKEWYERDYLQDEMELDPKKPFFEQFEELLKKNPIGALLDEGSNTNSFGIELIEANSCYLTFFALKSFRIYNALTAMHSEDCVNILTSYHLRNCSYANHCFSCFNCTYIFETYETSNSAFLFDCRNSEFCFGATNKRHAKYLWFNEQLSKEEWEKRRAEVDLGSYTQFSKYQKQFYQMMNQEAIWPENFNVRAQDCTGDYLMDCLNSKMGFAEKDSKNCFWTQLGERNEHTYFNMWTGGATDVYSSNGSKDSRRTVCCHYTKYCQNMEYSFLCFNCENCFGCINLKRKKFCIFNKQYSEEEYWKRVDEIKCGMLERGEYGKFFPAKFSPMGFQYAFGELFEGHTDEELKQYGSPIFDSSVGEITDESEHSAMNVSDLPDSIDEVKREEIVGKPLYDPESKRLFSIIGPEFDLMKKLRIPLHRQHFFNRLRFLNQHVNLMVSEMTKCTKCEKEIRVNKNKVFSNRKIYCQEHYLTYIESNG